ncbi:MAG: hypothetical protein E7321_00245 [Clostridiales bacterium]|nr:hypothetical protein [Clostridiales bacterium]
MAVEVQGTMIRIPQGDTGAVKFAAEKGKITQEDVGVFTMVRRDGTLILRKMLLPDAEGNAFDMMFTYEDTARIKPDHYEWSFRVVRDGVFDANGRLNGTRSQHTAVLKGRLSVLAVAGGAR